MPKKPALPDSEIVQGRISITGGDGFNPYSEKIKVGEREFSPFAGREQRGRVRGVLDRRFDAFCKERIRSQLASLIRQLRLVPTGAAAKHRVLADIDAQLARNAARVTATGRKIDPPSPKWEEFLGRRKFCLHAERAPGMNSCRRELTELFGQRFPEDDLRAAMDQVRKEERERPAAEEAADVEIDAKQAKEVADRLEAHRPRLRHRH